MANPDARRAAAYGVLSLLVPLLIPVALVFAARGIARRNANAWPPNPGYGNAVAGLVFAALSAVLWVVIVALILQTRAATT